MEAFLAPREGMLQTPWKKKRKQKERSTVTLSEKAGEKTYTETDRPFVAM